MPTAAQILTYLETEIAGGDSLGIAKYCMLAGTSAPPSTAMQWLDTTVAADPLAKMYNGSAWTTEAFAPTGGDGDLERILNTENETGTGLIPVAVAQLYLFNQGIWETIKDGGSNTNNPQQMRDVCNAVVDFCTQDKDPDLDPTNAVLQAALSALVAAGLVTSAQVTGFNALGSAMLSAAEVQWGAGTYLTHGQIAQALGRGNG